MANFKAAGQLSPGQSFTITWVTQPVDTDTLTINGITQSIANFVKAGVLTRTANDTSGKTSAYYLFANPEIVGQIPNGSSVSTNS